MKKINHKSVERFCRYRQILLNHKAIGDEYIFSHQLAKAVGASPAQVRRDMMILNLSGSPQRGYKIERFLEEIESIIDSPLGINAALIGIGHLGKAILSYFTKRRPNLQIIAAFDVDADKVDRVVSACRTYHLKDLKNLVKANNIMVGIITVPEKEAQAVADILVEGGVKGIVNFAPVKLNVPKHVYVEELDITTTIEKTAYFAKNINS